MTTVLVVGGGGRALAKRRRHHRFFLSAVTYPTKTSLGSTNQQSLRCIMRGQAGKTSDLDVIPLNGDDAGSLRTPDPICCVIALAVKGLENPACVLLRQCVELVLKHIYFTSHPVEYGWARLRNDYREQSFQYLIEYLSRTNECRSIKLSPNPCERLNLWYGILSRHVHVQNIGFMGYKTVTSAHQPDINVIKRLEEKSKEMWPLLTILLIAFSPRKYLTSSEIEKRLMRYPIPRGLRAKLDDYLNRVA